MAAAPTEGPARLPGGRGLALLVAGLEWLGAAILAVLFLVAMAAVTRGCPWPMHGTLLYASRYRRPAASVIQTPSADATWTGTS